MGRDPKDAGEKPPFRGEEPQDDTGHQAAMTHAPDSGADRYVGHDRLTDKVVVVTGGDSGIGRAVAAACAGEGADVVVHYFSHADDAQETRRLVEAAGRRCSLVQADLGGELGCKHVVDAAVAAHGRIDVLINNAAHQDKAVERFEDLDAARVLRTFQVNILAMFSLTRLALPHMKAGGVVINTASIQAYQPSAAILDYAATKGAIVTFTKGLAQELIERGIRVNCVAPGPVWTPLITASFDQKKIETFGAQNPMKRPAQPAELAGAYVFLACDESRFVNGEVLGVTGGKPLG